VVEPSARACWKGILIENIAKIKKQHLRKTATGVTENEITQKAYF
jgi:hypothetical protein